MRARQLLLVASIVLLPSLAASQEERPNSPRATLEAFRAAAHEGRWDEAARFLGREGPDAQQLARRLAAVLQTVTLDSGAVSDAPEGALDDRLHPQFEELARVAGPAGRVDPVRLQRLGDGRWVFAPGTVNRIEGWYEALPDRWLRELLPEWLQRTGPRGLLWWQLLALPVFIALAWVLGRFLGAALRWLLRALARRTTSTFDDALLARLKEPMTLFASTVAARLLLPYLALTPEAHGLASAVIQALTLTALFWAGLRTVDLAVESARSSPFVKQRPETLALLPLGSKAAKIAIVIIAVVTVFQKLGYPVASLVAGLGIGGLAFALAAQKTVENLFGSVTLGVDQPFRPGDFVKIEDFMGTVETVGLRSTRIRTLNRTLITLPNGKLADMKIETFAARDRMRLFATLNLVYSTTGEQLRAIVADVTKLLTDHPKRFQADPPRVFFVALGASSLDVELFCFIDTPDWNEFQAIRQEILLDVIAIVERHGSSFAYPTQTLHLAQPQAAPART